MGDYVLALDQGTSSSRAMVFDREARSRGVGQQAIPQIYPRPGWVEHDPITLLNSQINVARQAVAAAGIAPGDIAAIGIANQRETTIVWDRKTGEPVCNAIVWQDRRTAAECDRISADGGAESLHAATGLIPDAYFSATKLRWILDNVPGVRDRAADGRLAFGTVDAWLVWNLTGRRTHATDVTNASRTLLLNLHTGQWDDDLLARFDIPRSVLPEVLASDGSFGVAQTLFEGTSIPIRGVAGDQQAALFGQTCFSPGSVKCTYGTGCFMLLNVGETPQMSRQRLLSTPAWRRGNRTTHALEGSVFTGGAVVQWLRDGLGIVDSAAGIESLASQVPDSGGVYLVPAFAGLGAPHWDQYARGTIAGLTYGTTRAHIARAALDGIAFQVADLLDVMRSDSQLQIAELRVDGGAAANNLLMQSQADLLGIPVVRPRTLETTALGAAYLAGLSVGFWRSTEQIASNWAVDRVFEPAVSPEMAAHRRSRWRDALGRSMDWEKAPPPPER